MYIVFIYTDLPICSSCCKCGYQKSQHASEAITPGAYTNETWNKDRHTCEVPTDAFGKISFGGLVQRLGNVRTSFLSFPLCLPPQPNHH